MDIRRGPAFDGASSEYKPLAKAIICRQNSTLADLELMFLFADNILDGDNDKQGNTSV